MTIHRTGRIVLVAAVSIIAVALGAASTGILPVASAKTISVTQVDPFDRARNHIQARQNADALALIDSGQFEVNLQTSEGYSLLHYAAGAGNLDIVRALIARGADPTLRADTGTTPYQMAVGTLVQAEIRRAMAAQATAPAAPPATPRAGTPAAGAGASSGMCAMVRAENVNDGRSPAERPFLKAKDAVWYNHPDELVGLLDDCVTVDQRDAYGSTLLHHAAARDRVALAEILLERGAGRAIRNNDGQTAAQLATSPEMRRLLGPAPANAAPAAAASPRAVECRQQYEADAALASDSTGRMSAMRRWQQCLDTGRYW